VGHAVIGLAAAALPVNVSLSVTIIPDVPDVFVNYVTNNGAMCTVFDVVDCVTVNIAGQLLWTFRPLLP
jgi:hypothetical protein